MSYKDKNDINFKDYLDVSSEDEPIKNNKKEESNIIKNNKWNNKEYHSYKNKDIYLEDKYYHKKKRKRSSESSSSRYRKNYNKSRSRSHHHRNKKYHYHYRYKSNESDFSNKKINNRSSSNSISSYYKKDKYRNRNKKYRDDDNIYEKKYNKRNSDSKSNSSNFKKEEKDNENNKNELKKRNKWTDGEKKEEFKQIKIEKYDKNKSLKEIQKKKEKDEEILKLKKDLNKKEENKEKEIEKEKPNFEPSGILLKDLEMDYNKSINSKIIINYNPPNDSIIPDKNEIWFLFKFSEDKKEDEETYKLIDKEYFLIGKDPRICDIRIKQKNISRQHAVIQFRKIRKEKGWQILPYLIDLNSTNGTYLNGDKIDNKKYYELREKDQLNFGDKNIDFLLMKTK